jgi:signal transduction histidine kinase
MNRLIGDLTDAANIAAGTLTVTRAMADLSAIVSEALEMFHPLAIERRVALEAAIESPLRKAFFDPARIYQVITNLLGNAIKFTPAGGTVKVRLYSAADDLRVAVSDTGIGIPPDQLSAVFDRNVQLAKDSRRGAGLGLYISRSIVLRHGGRIWAESRLGEGSTFFFTVPSLRQGNQV